MFIKIRVITGAPKEVIQKIEYDHIEMYIREPPERNLANKRIFVVLREMYPDHAIKMIKGHHSSAKLFSIDKKNN